jgi:LysM repeat protein
MKINLFKVFSLTAIITLFSTFLVQAQVSTSSSGARNIQPDKTGEEKVNQIISDSGNLFKEGLMNLQVNRRPQAREKFDKSVEVFLASTVNVNSNAKLKGCYDQLIETVYRIEFPTTKQQPQIKSLALSCGWNIDNGLADSVAKITQTSPKATTTASNVTDKEKEQIQAIAGNPNADIPQIGFSEQRYEPSPLDELSKLELTPEEENVVNTPEGQMEYQKIQLAVNGGSLGLKFQMHPMVQQFIAHYQGRGRKTMETGLYRSGMFSRMARRIFRKEGIPENMIWLGQVESTWKPSALSWAAASGLWQFIPGTGARYGLRRTAHIDERNSFEKATTASAQYLKFLANRYGGNWELAMAAYNSGEGNVDRAIRRAGAANFWLAYPYLPKETRNYVPNILATILIANNPNAYGFSHVRPAPQLTYDMIRVPSSTSLGLVAQASDTSVEYLRYLNPELRTNMTPPEPYVIRVPAGRANNVLAVMKRVPGGRGSNVELTTAVAGESLQNVANRTGISVEQLQAVNGGAIPKDGKIVVPTNNVKRTSFVRPATPTTTAPATKGVQLVKAQSGDTVAKIAARFGVPAIEVAKFNGLSNAVNSPLPIGREIRIPSR